MFLSCSLRRKKDSKLRGKTSGLCCSLREAREKDSKLLRQKRILFSPQDSKLRGKTSESFYNSSSVSSIPSVLSPICS